MSISFLVIVVSDNVFQGLKKDISGEFAVETLKDNGYVVVDKVVVPNNPREIIRVIRERRGDVLLFIGGTGPGPRDITVDTVESIAWRKLPGFGELFRRLSFEEIGYRGIISRAELFILYDGRIAVVLPGSTGAVKLGLKILLETIPHIYEEVWRFEGPHKT
ncbi:molybdenum cofactor synthesis domain [Staphylothermus marinus F1]|uniref:Molybdenum cofactor synthesis domain n=1 Tax=Staphylothermus marinus (strain ATCC 43588 / DSM 3639 / JCM 9404 / F1) TaxID=399550 RepID=A3DLA6_STAMF|nr:MogA/MoaB family molybdenum cofactor biosynthesis protein [Staphylothermus marinus]ABN69416.1 molybdenum cofactor synthesis domain [Staphylothermus marinus F1]